MFEIYGIFVFLLGTVIGSFLNVVIYRFNTGRGLGGRSFCFTCRRTLSWHELVPIASFLSQRGKCKGCASKISWQYPLVEAITGFVFVSLFIKFLPDTTLMYSFSWMSFFPLIFFTYIFCILIVISVYDYHHNIIPDTFVWLFNILAFLSLFIFTGMSYAIHLPSLWSVLAGPLIALPFFFLWWVTGGKAMGFGDVKLALGMGWLLGITGGFAAVLVSFWIGGLWGIGMLLLRKKTTLKSHVPFGPFMCTAIFFVFLFSITITQILTTHF